MKLLLLASSIAILAGSPPSASVSYLVKQGFEGTGFDNGPESWAQSNSASIDEDYTTTPGEGSQSIHASVGSLVYATSPTWTAGDEFFGYCMFRFAGITAGGSGQAAITFSTSSTDTVTFRVNSTGVLTAVHGTRSAGGPTLSANTWYHIWWRYVKGTGANGILEVYTSTTDTKPSVTINITDGNSTLQPDRLTLQWRSGDNWQMDKVRVDNVDIGSAPE